MTQSSPSTGPQPLWRLTSGTFLGWRVGNDFFDATGNRAGKFSGDKLFRDSDGTQVGFVYPRDSSRVGWKNGYMANSSTSRGSTTTKITPTPPGNVEGSNDAAWIDPSI